MSTPRAILRRIRGIHSDILPTGPCCLVGDERCELTPRGVMDAFRETMVMRHPVDREVFDRDQIKAVNNTAAMLVGEVAPPPGDAFMHARHHRTSLRALRCTLFFLAETPLYLRQRLFLGAEEARVGNLLTSREGG